MLGLKLKHVIKMDLAYLDLSDQLWDIYWGHFVRNLQRWNETELY